MSGMFDSFKKPTNDIPSNINCFPPKTDGEHEELCPSFKPPINPNLKPYKPEIPFEDYNAHGELVGYWWYEGDQIQLEFNIEGEVVIGDSENYITAEEFLQNKKITFKLFNFRREEIISTDYDASTTITFTIDEVLAKKLKKGVYYCSLDIWDGIAFNRTIYTQESCSLTIK